jgi:hypothetical protein
VTRVDDTANATAFPSQAQALAVVPVHVEDIFVAAAAQDAPSRRRIRQSPEANMSLTPATAPPSPSDVSAAEEMSEGTLGHSVVFNLGESISQARPKPQDGSRKFDGTKRPNTPSRGHVVPPGLPRE